MDLLATLKFYYTENALSVIINDNYVYPSSKIYWMGLAKKAHPQKFCISLETFPIYVQYITCVCMCVRVCNFNTSDQREKPVYKSHIALVLEC